MSSTQDNSNLLIFSDNLDDIVLLKEEITNQNKNFKITLSILKDELHNILSMKQHNFLIFLDTKREINLNEIEVFVKGVNPNIKLIFLDYLHEQIVDENNPKILHDLVTKILNWISLLNKVDVEDDFSSINHPQSFWL